MDWILDFCSQFIIALQGLGEWLIGRYTLVGLWVIALAPFLFIRLGLAKRESEP